MMFNTIKKTFIKAIFTAFICCFTNHTFAINASFTAGTNVQINGSSVTKNAGINSWNAAAVSENVLEGGDDGHVEVSAGETNKNKMIGLAEYNTNASFTSIDYAIYLSTGGVLKIYHSGADQGTFGSYVAGDVFRIEREGSTIRYFKNNVEFNSTPTNPNNDLVVDMSFHSAGGSFQNVTTSFDIPVEGPSCDDGILNGDETGIDCGGSCAFICDSGNTHNITWETPGTNVNINSNNLTKNGGGTGWNAGTVSENELAANTNGWVQVEPATTSANRMFGLSTSETDVNFNSINYAFYLSMNGILRIYENGANQNINSTYSVNDEIRIERHGNSILYKKNGTVLKTSSTNANSTLVADVSIHTGNGTISNATASFPSEEVVCNTTVYADTDGDGYGDPNNTDTNCANPLPTGWVGNSNDCDDTDANINPTTVWYQDNDSDGFGNSNVSVTQCEQPNGYVLTNNDCDDTTNDPNNNCTISPPLWSESGENIYRETGKVWIGNPSLDVSSTDYNLFVEDGIMTERLKVAIAGSGDWADFVFKKGYKLITIEALQEFIKENGHLPNVPSAKEVADKGIDVAKMNAMLLQQIEESKLYIIELNERIINLEQKIQKIESKK